MKSDTRRYVVITVLETVASAESVRDEIASHLLDTADYDVVTINVYQGNDLQASYPVSVTLPRKG